MKKKGGGKVSFTIKCNRCGESREFTSESDKYAEHISIDIYTRGSYLGTMPVTIDINCENPKCYNTIEVKY